MVRRQIAPIIIMIVQAITFAIAAIAQITISSTINERHPFIFFLWASIGPLEDI